MLHILATNVSSHRTLLAIGHRTEGGGRGDAALPQADQRANRNNEATTYIFQQHASFAAHEAYPVHLP